MSKKVLNVFISLVMIFTLIGTFPTNQVSAYTDDFVYTSDNHFMLNGHPFYHSGTNNYYLIYKDNFMVDDVLTTAAKMNLKVIRTWGFLDGTSPDGYSMQPKLGVYADDYPELYPKSGFERIDYAISKAQALGIKFVIPLVNYWPDFGGMPQYVAWTGAGSTTEFYTNQACITAYKNYINHFLNHVNQYTGVKYKDDPTIMSIELANEPRCGSDPTGITLTNWVKNMSDYVRSIDKNHLICVGDEGFYNRPGPYSDGMHNGQEGVDWDKLLTLPNISYGTVHDYGTDSWGKDIAWSVQWVKDHITDGHAAGKPVIIEEFGSRNKSERDSNLTQITNAVETTGGDGAYSWMLVGLDDEKNPPVYYNTLWDDGFQFNYPTSTTTLLTNHATYMNNLNVTSAPSSFTQTSPVTGISGVSAQPEFSWTASSNATSYSLIVSESSNYSNPVINVSNLTSNSYSATVSLAYNTKYYWRVTATNFIGSTIATNQGISFTTQTPPPMPGTFSQSAPTAGSTGVSTTPTFSWTESSCTDGYSLVVSTNNTYTNPVINVSNLTSTSYTAITELANGTDYFWKVTSTNLTGSTVASNIGVSFTTQMPSPIIDDFERYNGLNSNVQTAYAKNSNGNSVTVVLDPTNKGMGSYGMSYAYTVGSPNYAGVTKNLNGSSWKGYDAINLWLKPDGTNRTLTLQFKETTGEYWESYYTVSGTAASTVSIPFTSFVHPGWYSGGNGVIDKDSVSEYSIYIGQGLGTVGSGTIYLDDILLSNGGGASDTQAPTAPTSLASPSKTTDTVSLTWTAATDNVEVASYDIYNGSTLVGSSTIPSYTVTGLTANTTYSFTVKAKDAAGNVSASSATLNVTTSEASDTIGSINVFYQCSNTANHTNSLKPDFRIVNTGTTTISLSDINVRYWFTNDSNKVQSASIYWASVGTSNVTTSFIKMSSTKPTADYCLELGFTTSAGMLAPGESVELHIGFNTTDWSNYDQSNDYSFNSAATGYIENYKFTGYISKKLQWGMEP